MTDGLLFVLSEPGSVPQEEFDDWYDHEHAPARLTVPGIRSGDRYRAADDVQPTWLAIYSMALAALNSGAYSALRTRSPREQGIVDRLATLDRRVYAQVSTDGMSTEPPPHLLTVAQRSTDPDALLAWYEEEHAPLLAQVPGWRRTSWYRGGAEVLAVHELDGPEVFATPEYQRAVTTPRRDVVRRTVTARERRLFTHHSRVLRGRSPSAAEAATGSA